MLLMIAFIVPDIVLNVLFLLLLSPDNEIGVSYLPFYR